MDNSLEKKLFIQFSSFFCFPVDKNNNQLTGNVFGYKWSDYGTLFSFLSWGWQTFMFQ